MRIALMTCAALCLQDWFSPAQTHTKTEIVRLDGSKISSADAEAFARKTLDHAHVMGAQLAVLEKGDLVWSVSCGFRGRDPDLRMTRETTTWAASITKAVFATYVMQLVERGEFQLDVPVSKQLPQPLDRYQVYKESGAAIVSEPDWPLVTPRILLSHTSGLLNFAYLEPDKKLHLHFRPGSKFSYSRRRHQSRPIFDRAEGAETSGSADARGAFCSSRNETDRCDLPAGI